MVIEKTNIFKIFFVSNESGIWQTAYASATFKRYIVLCVRMFELSYRPGLRVSGFILTAYYEIRFTDFYVDEDYTVDIKALIYGNDFRFGFNSEEYVCREQDLFGIEHHLQLLDVREHVPYEIGLKTEEDISPVSMIGSAAHVCTELFREYSLIKIELSNENTLFLFF